MVNEAHAPWRDRSLFDILHQMRHDGCGGLPGGAELLTGIEGRVVPPGATDRTPGAVSGLVNHQLTRLRTHR